MKESSSSKSFMGKAAAVMAAFMLFSAVSGTFSYPAYAAESDGYTRHTVASGETLSTIAKKYGVTVDEIVAANNITDISFIATGTVLLIPVSGTSTTASASQTAASADTDTETSGYSSMLTTFDTKISVTFTNTDVRDVLTAFALNMGYNIIYKGSTTAKISLTLKDVTLNEALDYVMKVTDLTYINDGKTIIVGAKDVIAESFSEAMQITEFVLTYVSAETIMNQISTFGIDVNATLSGGNNYRFIAQGLPADLSKVRDLISMIDRRENSTDSGTAVASTLYNVTLENISASEFQRILSSASLPSGVILASKPNTLYIFARPSEHSLIESIKKIADVKDSTETAAVNTEQIKEENLKYVNIDLIGTQITSNASVTIIKVSTNKTKFWIKGLAADIADAENIIGLLDIAENAELSEEQLISKFTTIKTTYITAERLRDTLAQLSISLVSVLYEENPKTLYVLATEDDLATVNSLLEVIDVEANAKATTEEMISLFRPIKCSFITAEQLNTVLTKLSLPTGIIFADNPKTLYIYASEADISSIQDVLNVVDTKENAAAEEAEVTLRSLSCRFITAEQFNTTLSSLSMPTGIIFEYNPKVLYLNVTDEQFQEICTIQYKVDTFENSKASADSFTLYQITLNYIDVDTAVEFLNQLGLDIQIITSSNSQKRLWIMGEISEYYKAQAAVANIDVFNSNASVAHKTFTLNNINAAEMKSRIDNLNRTGVSVYISNGNDSGNEIIIYYPNDLEYEITALVYQLDADASKYTEIVDRINDNIDPQQLTERLDMISKLSGVDRSKFNVSDNASNTVGQYLYLIYLENATRLEIDAVKKVVEQLG